MSYQVLARKWRPHTFTEMVGQEHVLRAIINALDNDRLHHAFLFTGTRGVGKTSIARILAKSLNCQQGVSSTPCGQCSACVEIDEGRFFDLIEVDAASRTKIEDTRELLDNVQYAPTVGRYKVYLIDEVHMLSKHSFNALLKTLEEPPPHVKFLLATTDPQKLPVTILSRCLQFNLKALPPELIRDHLIHILKAEQVEFDVLAVRLLAHAADGSVRDALSLMDQGIAYGQGRLGADDMRAMLGTIDRACLYPLLTALAAADASAVLACVSQLAEQAPDYSALLEEIISILHRLALLQAVPDAPLDMLADQVDVDDLQALLTQLSAEDIQLYYQIALIGRRDLPLAPIARSGFEMVLLRMLAFRPDAASSRSLPGASPTAAHTSSAQRNDAGRQQTEHSTATPAPAPADSSATLQVDNPSTGAVQETAAVRPLASTELTALSDWGEIVESLSLTGLLKQLAANCLLEKRDEVSIHLRLDTNRAHLVNDAMKIRLEKKLQEYFSLPLRLVLHVGEVQGEEQGATPAAQQQQQKEDRQRDAEEAINNDDSVRTFQETFDAKIVPESIRPLET